MHLDNPNNRQPSAAVTIVNPNVQILSLEQITDSPRLMLMSLEADDILPGFVEYKYRAKVQHKDGTVTEEIISAFVEK